MKTTTQELAVMVRRLDRKICELCCYSGVLIIPMAPPLRSHIELLPLSDNLEAPLHPRAFAILARTGSASGISNAFSDLLVQAGLRPRPASVSHRSRGIGHSGRRKINTLSFHSLRRTATTLLHEAGVPSTVAQALTHLRQFEDLDRWR